MTNAARISPMTLYYLRRLIRARQSELTWQSSDNCAVINLDEYLSQLSRGGLEDLISSKVLERLVTLHQTLISKSPDKREQILDIESQIYETLSLQWNPPADAPEQDLICLDNFSPQKCREILKHLYTMKQKYEFLIGPKMVQNYLMKSRPHDQWPENVGEASPETGAEHGRETLMINRLTVYEQWIAGFIQTCESLLEQQENAAHEKAEAAHHHEPPSLSWEDVCQKVTQLVSVTHNSKSRRCRNLLTQMNLLLEKSAQVLAPDLAISHFLNSRPENSWCQMFQISKEGKVVFQGNSWELVTNSRFNLYLQWMDAFIQKCNQFNHSP